MTAKEFLGARAAPGLGDLLLNKYIPFFASAFLTGRPMLLASGPIIDGMCDVFACGFPVVGFAGDPNHFDRAANDEPAAGHVAGACAAYDRERWERPNKEQPIVGLAGRSRCARSRGVRGRSRVFPPPVSRAIAPHAASHDLFDAVAACARVRLDARSLVLCAARVPHAARGAAGTTSPSARSRCGCSCPRSRTGSSTSGCRACSTRATSATRAAARSSSASRARGMARAAARAEMPNAAARAARRSARR